MHGCALPPPTPLRRSGAQAVERAMHLLHLISIHGRKGLQLGDLARLAGLDPGTARRLLLALMRGGFVSQEAATRRYFLGLEFFSVAAAAANRFDLSEARRSTLSRLSRATGAASVWFARDGCDIVCIDAVHAPGQPVSVDIGARRPIGADSFGIALLAALPEEECRLLAADNLPRFSRAADEAARILNDRLSRARREGYAMDYDDPWKGCSLAVAVMDRNGRAEGVLGLSAPSFRPEAVANLAWLVAGQARTYQDATSRLPTTSRGRKARASDGLFAELAVSHGEIGETV